MSGVPGPRAIDKPLDGRLHGDTLRDGLCRTSGINPDTWFPPTTRHTDNARAKAFCRVCPVLLTCRAEGLALSQDYGIWGGLDPYERQEVRRRVRRRA